MVAPMIGYVVWGLRMACAVACIYLDAARATLDRRQLT